LKKIKLTQGYEALVDDEDFERINKNKWCSAVYKGKNRVDAMRRESNKVLRMHREILGITNPKVFIDHINHNALDNRKDNLRVCDIGQNNRNRRKQAGTSKYKGVYKKDDCNRWAAQITHNKKTYYIGLFKSEKEASMAYDKSSRELHKQFGYTNKEVITINK